MRRWQHPELEHQLGRQPGGRAYGSAVDTQNNVYVAGTTYSPDYFTTPGAYATDTPAPGDSDGFTLKLSPPGSPATPSAHYVYDAEGNRVKRTLNGVTTLYVGAIYEREGNSTRKSYYFGGQAVAVRQYGILSYLLSDHLGSTSVTLDSVGTVVSELRYAPFGRTRYTSGITPTDRRFTGQRFEGDALGGLYDYGARLYDPNVGLFVQPDPIVPDPMLPASFNRFAYE